MYVVVELEEDYTYGPDGSTPYPYIGKVYGPFETEEEADEFEAVMWKTYKWSEFSTKELTSGKVR